MRIVVLVKPVPDPGQERMGGDGRLDRAASPTVMNGNDEYCLEAALQLVDAGGGEVILLAMAPATAPETLRKGLAMGAHRAVLVTDEALAGADARTTARVLAAALRTLEYDLVMVGENTSDGGGGVLGAMIAATLNLPYLSSAAHVEPAGEGTVRVRRLAATGHDILEAATPALVAGTQLLGEPRYPSLKGIMGARSKEIAVRSLADLDLDPGAVGAGSSTTVLLESRTPEARGAARIVRDVDAATAATGIVDFLVERRVLA